MKNRFWILVLLALVALALPLTANAATQSGKCGDNLTWTLDGDGVLTISGTGEMTSHPWDGSRVVKLVIEDGVTGIADVFSHSKTLTAVVIPGSVKTLGEGIFAECPALASVTIMNGVETIGDHAFFKCEMLTGIEIPDSVTTIGRGAFQRCGLTAITLGSGLTFIGDGAFDRCASLETVTILGGEPRIQIGESVFNQCASLISAAIGSGVKSMDRYAFANCEKLENVTMQDGLLSLGDAVFMNCVSLKEITIPDTVTSLGSGLFDHCAGLTRVTIGNRVESIGECAFRDCGSLTEVSIPDSVTSIVWQGSAGRLFDGCSSLARVTIGNGVPEIGSHALAGCARLERVTIGNSVGSIGDRAFSQCEMLTSVEIPSSVTSFGASVFAGCSSDLVIQCYSGSKAEEYAEANSIKAELLAAKPVILSQPADTKTNVGAAAAFTITARDAASYQWYSRSSETAQWTPVTGGTSASWSFIAEESQNGWQFCCQATNIYGSVLSDAATLTVSAEHSTWDCPSCGRIGNNGNYCGGCAHPAPWMETP